MKILFTIAHYFNPEGNGKHVSLRKDPRPRIQALEACLRALMGSLGPAQCVINLDHRHTEPPTGQQAHELDIIICTTNQQHLLNALTVPATWYLEHPTAAEPMMLPFVCHDVLRDRLGHYDYYAYMEDDLILQDPWFFTKLEWFNQQTELVDLLQPNRFELGEVAPFTKAYIDGDIGPRAAGRFQNPAERPSLQARALGQPLLFKRPLNPHAGCFFLTEAQLAHWVRQPHFGDRDCRFVSPLESAATLGIMKTFRIYKVADPPGFLELRHFGEQFLRLIGNQVRLERGVPTPSEQPAGV